MDILVGKLGNQPFAITDPSVSRRHAIVTFNETNGEIIIRDQNSVNGTYVKRPDGAFQRITVAKVSMNTVIRIGIKQTFTIAELRGSMPSPPPASGKDISHLKYIYDSYNYNKVDIETKTSNIMMYRIMAMSLSGVAASLLNVLFKVEPEVNVFITLIVIVLAFAVVSIMNRNLIRRKHSNEFLFKKRYICPECSYFFGQKPYENIVAEGKCPNPACRCKFIVKKGSM